MINRILKSKRLRRGVKSALRLAGVRRFGSEAGRGLLRADGQGVAEYWTQFNVTQHHPFVSAQESLDYFHWRNDQYYPYIEYMPVSGQDGKVVLDYGCGPGHDLVGFAVYSKPKRLIGMDVSSSSLAEATARLALHGAKAEMVLLDPAAAALPLETASVDLVHCSGVIHHMPDPLQILRELRRVLKPSGNAQIMVYNYDSIWLHLFVAYTVQIVEGRYADSDIRSAFARTTDGEECPISRVYAPGEFIALCREAGFAAEFIGAAIAMHEALIAPKRFEAVSHRKLSAESRKFLLSLEVDQRGLPTYRGQYAGVDACYRLRAA